MQRLCLVVLLKSLINIASSAKAIWCHFYFQGGSTFALAHSGQSSCAIPDGDTIVLAGGKAHSFVTRWKDEKLYHCWRGASLHMTRWKILYRYDEVGFVEELPKLPESRYGHSCAALPSDQVRRPFGKLLESLWRHFMSPEETLGARLPRCSDSSVGPPRGLWSPPFPRIFTKRAPLLLAATWGWRGEELGLLVGTLRWWIREFCFLLFLWQIHAVLSPFGCHGLHLLHCCSKVEESRSMIHLKVIQFSKSNWFHSIFEGAWVSAWASRPLGESRKPSR